MLAYRLILLGRWIFRNQKTAWIVSGLAKSRIGVWLILTLLAMVPNDLRPICLKAAQKLRSEDWNSIIDAAQRRWNNYRGIRSLEVLILALVGAQRYPQVLQVLDEAGPAVVESSASLRNAMTVASVEVGDFRRVKQAARLAFASNPQTARVGSDLMFAAYACGQLRDFSGALEFLAAHYDMIEPSFAPHSDARDQAIRDKIGTAFRKLMPDVAAGAPNGGKTAVFFLNSTQALGHAILDPYHFLALSRSHYDRVVFIGPPRSCYSAPTAACLRIVEQYGNYIETDDSLLQNLSWMSLGTISVDAADLIVANYWSLLREATLKSTDQDDGFRHNAWHMTLPQDFDQEGCRFATAAGIDLSRPIVTLHARDVGYHKLLKQSYRDVDITDYILAVEHILARGYQIVRLGDSSMQRLNIDSKDYHELPFLPGYGPNLDAFFIHRSAFMIGCQSGPCAYARALGKPLLSINAVYHYTLLPSPCEMAAFKHYMVRDAADTPPRELRLSEILERNLFWCENVYQFEERSVELHALAPEEILDAVSSMIAWIENPDLAPTPAQIRCIELIRAADQRIRNAAERPVADFLGMSLPGYRIASKQAQTLLDQTPPRKLSA